MALSEIVFKVKRLNVPRNLRRDLYHDLLTQSWPFTIVGFFLLFLSINIIFATLYWLDPSALLNSDGSWSSAFFFSVQTLATIGYGYISPGTFTANLLVTLEAALGVVMIAIMSGFFFAKFSRAQAKIDFTDKILITQFDGRPTLIFRMINIRNNHLIDSKVSATALKDTLTTDGQHIRRFLDLNLVRSNVPILALSMSMMHVIDEVSPLWGISEESLKDWKMDILITLIGTDGTFGQTIHAGHRYELSDIVFNKRFKDMVNVLSDGTRVVDYAAFNEII